MPLLQILERVPPVAPPPARGAALWALGFRPFYLLASVYAALSVPLWVLQVSGWLPWALPAGPAWHAHEMLFGVVQAVVVGFLFTAARTWTQQPTPSGPLLAGFAALWLAGRVLLLTPWAVAAAVVNVAFPLAAALALARVLWRVRQARNAVFVGLLLLFALAAAAVHLPRLGWASPPAWLGLPLALDGLLLLLTLMSGRVLPMFTQNGVPGLVVVRRPWVDRLALGAVLLVAVGDGLGLPFPAQALLTALAAAALARRSWLWRPWRTGGVPLVWILHAGSAWLGVHLLLRSAAVLGWVPTSAATHALTVGAAGGLIIGMMVRTARGHTGLPLRADRADVACFCLVSAAAVLRVAGPLVMPGASLAAVQGSALLWCAGFALYALRYGPVLCRPRPDGRPG